MPSTNKCKTSCPVPSTVFVLLSTYYVMMIFVKYGHVSYRSVYRGRYKFGALRTLCEHYWKLLTSITLSPRIVWRHRVEKSPMMHHHCSNFQPEIEMQVIVAVLPTTKLRCYATLRCTILYYTILYYTILHYTTLQYTVLYYTILYCTIVYYAILNYVTL